MTKTIPKNHLSILEILFVCGLIICAGILLKGCEQPGWAQEIPSNTQIVNAIYLAEGGKNAQFPFGIRSITCNGYSQCRKICFTTVERNRQRYAKYGQKNKVDFITFLGNRYCPTKGAISHRESVVNKNWIKNVQYFLRRDHDKRKI